MRMPFRSVTAALAATFVAVAFGAVLAAPAAAQEDLPLVQLSTLEFAPGDIEMFLEQVKTVRDAAEEIGLAPEFRWSLYRWENTLVFASWPESMATFDDPAAMVEAFQGTPVESRVMAAFERAEAAQVIEGRSEVLISHPDRGYEPASSAVANGQGGVYVFKQWPKAGQREAYLESVSAATAMLGEMGGVYPVGVHESYLGDGAFHIVVSFDDLSSFYGENSMQSLLEGTGKAAEWAEMGRRHQALLSRGEARILFYLPNYSYMPDEDS